MMGIAMLSGTRRQGIWARSQQPMLQWFDQIHTPAAYLGVFQRRPQGEFSAVKMIGNISLQSSQL
ncbi:hypothetical protein [Paracoccus sp. DMF]|uniref:hypothetical protein n=1 Tax=Paracoccus sp. DMF TaxID=400837 RepID=UPI0021E4FD17|nr:hypothetical protein [Paracoccus sp. DMF]MCV2445693.1 hypothetical protein [Paracoccus sp. DMF]